MSFENHQHPYIVNSYNLSTKYLSDILGYFIFIYLVNTLFLIIQKAALRTLY
jgi:hypothetical protein